MKRIALWMWIVSVFSAGALASVPALASEADIPLPDLSLVTFPMFGGTIAGGSLTFYGLMKAPGMEKAGMPLAPEAGLLVAFRSDIMHEVNPVTRGERYTLVSWFA